MSRTAGGGGDTPVPDGVELAERESRCKLSLGKVTGQVASRDRAALSQMLFKNLSQTLNARGNAVAGDPIKEARRFEQEADFLWNHNEDLRALQAIEARDIAITPHPKLAKRGGEFLLRNVIIGKSGPDSAYKRCMLHLLK